MRFEHDVTQIFVGCDAIGIFFSWAVMERRGVRRTAECSLRLAAEEPTFTYALISRTLEELESLAAPKQPLAPERILSSGER